MKRTKVGKFQFSNLVHKKILWFKVAMEDSAFVTVRQATKNLKHKQLSKSKKEFMFICCSDIAQQCNTVNSLQIEKIQ